MTNDPVIRYASVGILAITFLAILAILVHGYWINPSYQPPGLIIGLLSAILTAVVSFLGAHLGQISAQSGVSSGVQAAQHGLDSGVQASIQIQKEANNHGAQSS